MPGAMGSKVIRAEAVSAYSLCPRKAFLLQCTEERGTPHEYLGILEERAKVKRTEYLAALDQTSTSIHSYDDCDISSGIDALTEAKLKATDVEAYCDVLTRVSSPRRGDPATYEPTIIVGTPTIQKDQILNLSFTGYVLGQLQNRPPAAGYLVTADGKRHRIDLQPTYKTVRSIIERIKGWSADSPAQPPPVVLNKHCPYCPFKKACTELAEAADDLSLLDRMTAKAIQRYHNKGIFTINQLSFLFKPRRKRRRNQERPPHFDLEVQALAIRTGKVFIQALPEIQRSDIELFLDIEGVPDQQFSYLIGLLILDHGAATHHTFWADTIEDEESIWHMFVQKANAYPDAPIYHYGSFEARAFESVGKRFGPEFASIGKRLVNIIPHVYGKVYFPVRSNSLKALGKFLGASWTDPDASGLQSLVWRSRWEERREAAYKQKLISYNAEDCHALRLLLDEFVRLRTHADSELNIDYFDQPKQNTTRIGSELHAAFENVRRYANASYSKDRISFRLDTDAMKQKGPGAPKGHTGYQRIVPKGRGKVIRVASKRTCPKHKGERLQGSGRDAEKTIVDLAFTKNGCRKVVIKYAGEKRSCQLCQQSYDPPAIKKLAGNLFGHRFRAWAIYQRIVLRLPYRMIAQVMEDTFRERTTEATIINFIESFAEYYSRTESLLLIRLLESPFIHVDETRLSIQGVDHYVWVLTDGSHVVFRLTETREAAVVHKLLAGYKGVLVADFYPGYDAVECKQQKCWIHLIRDLNEDLWKFPFDEEFQEFVLKVKNLFLPMIEAIHRYGLRARNLRRFKRSVDDFYSAVIEGREYAMDVTNKYQKRFARYRESLFRFLDEDGIPWNNNMAERAIRHLAVQRKISGTLHKRSAVQYLVLLGIGQTCRFQGKSFLRFLLSEEIDVDGFRSSRRIKISKPIHREANP